MKKKIPATVLLVVLLVVLYFVLGVFSNSRDWVAEASRNGSLLLPVVAVAAFLDSFNPCAFSILFLTIAFLFNLGRSRKEVLKIGSVYIVGVLGVYVLIGLGILQVLQLFNTSHVVSKVGAVILLGWGLINLINKLIPNFPIKLKIPSFTHGRIAQLMHRSTVPAALGMGVLVGLFEFPCTGGPYLLVLGLLHDQSTYLMGLAYLVLYNLIFISPLVVILALASDSALYEKVKEWKKSTGGKVEFISAVVMILMALFVLWQ